MKSLVWSSNTKPKVKNLSAKTSLVSRTQLGGLTDCRNQEVRLTGKQQNLTVDFHNFQYV